MYAWRRANVAELNRRGRAAWESLGRLSGPELVVGDVGYRAGDRIVTLAPGADGEIVTSERGTVIGVDVRRRELGVTMADGRFQRFAGEDLDADHLTHGYAVTVHRSQSATVELSHSLEDGGGRELAYVKMSRARQRSTVYPVADSMEQAIEDLGRSWSHSRRIGWAIDKGVPSTERTVEPPQRTLDARLRHARLVAERDALAAVIPTDPGFEYWRAETNVRTLQHQAEALDKGDGWGVLRGTPVGDAAIAWKQALGEWTRCLAQADHAPLRERHQLRKRADRAAEQEGPLRDRFERLAGPERARIEVQLGEARELFAEMESRRTGALRFSIQHPEALRRLDRLGREIESLTFQLDLGRQALDGIPPRQPEPPARAHGIERGGHGLERSLGIER